MLIGMALCSSLVWAQAEPTIAEIYATAQSGKLDQAQVMVQQVLISHPKSAKAHFVQSELFARQGNLSRAREALVLAETEAPGLPFAKPEAVQHLRAQLAVTQPLATSGATAAPHTPPSPASSGNWALPVLLTGGVMLLGYFMFRKRAPAADPQAPVYPSGLSGPQTFGTAGQGSYGQPMYGQAPSSGLGGKIMGGVATGLAVGAGVIAAEAIGRSLMGDHNARASSVENYDNGTPGSFSGNADMGGQSFGLNDTSSWDDAGSSSDGGISGDWDN